MVTCISVSTFVSFNDQDLHVKFKIDVKNLHQSTAKISNLSLNLASETIDWNISNAIPLHKIPKLICKNFFDIQISMIDGIYRLNIGPRKGKIKLQAVETFNAFLSTITHGASKQFLYPILSLMVTLYSSKEISSLTPRDSIQLQKIVPFLASKDQSQLNNVPNLTLVECNDSILGNSLFAKAIRAAFPETVVMHSLAKELNTALKNDDPYIVPLDGELPGSPPEKPLTALLTEVLLSTKRIVLMGEAGSGKSFFLMGYVRDLLMEYRLGEPVPIYVALNKINKRDNIIAEFLKKFDLNEQQFKELDTVWFFDGYDELIHQDRNNLFNIFTANQLQLWPKAKFVFSCRDIFTAFEPQTCFAPPRKSVIQLDICSLNSSKINLFFTKYISSHATNWTLQQYQASINELELKSFIKRPFHLRCVADHLPLLVQNILKEGRKELFFWGLWVCSFIWREFNKSKKVSQTKRPLDYLNYILEVTHLMQLCGVRSLSSDLSEAIGQTSILVEASIQDYTKRIQILESEKKNIQAECENQPPGYSKDEKIEPINEKIMCFRSLIEEIKDAPRQLHTLLFNKASAPWQTSALLVKRRGRVEFVYPGLYDYLVEVGRDPESKRLLVEQLNSFAC